MFKNIHTLKPDTVIKFYLAKKGVSKKHKKNINRIKLDLLNDTKIYNKLASSGKFHEVSGKISNVDEDSKKSLKKLYETYVKESGVKKFIFEQSLYCAGCQKGYATDRATKDHFLPSSTYPNFFVLPWNLVPICGDCNRAKSDVSPKSSKENLPHPYYNTLLFKKNWLKVVIKKAKPLKYELTFDDALKPSEKQMVENHLIAYKLRDTFNRHMSVLFDEFDDGLRERFVNNGSANLKLFLDGERQRVHVSPSKLKTYWPINIEYVFISGLHDSDWFCDNYYR
ncbi:HNH endonuclease [Shewanella psychropiezotolerans]|uniref:HNH endonuclease n=1 Tax=Shewanella psychropiezotolerans TaxID=2593655 RepID=A0ABX5WTM0_9GAMM|nr:HNH endonuclease signature motif containing protein [Shewanella psychropiezotolerans]QDO82406.1 HNH endonuclease [Shewanella psychropiezotolerans]